MFAWSRFYVTTRLAESWFVFVRRWHSLRYVYVWYHRSAEAWLSARPVDVRGRCLVVTLQLTPEYWAMVHACNFAYGLPKFGLVSTRDRWFHLIHQFSASNSRNGHSKRAIWAIGALRCQISLESSTHVFLIPSVRFDVWCQPGGP